MSSKSTKIKQRGFLITWDITKVAATAIISIILTVMILGGQSSGPIYYEDRYILTGEFPNVTSSLVLDYQDYFDVQIINDLPKKHLNLLIIFAHGRNDVDSVSIELKHKTLTLTEIDANRVIWIACSIGIIDSLDLDTKHYSYSLSNENDTYYFKFTKITVFDSGIGITHEDVEIIGWASFFLDLIKSGMNWDDAEIIARNMTNDFWGNYYESIIETEDA